MRASGIPAQYVQGTLSQSQAQQLILSMFPASYQTVGYIPAGTQTSDPANDPQLLAETESHYWFQFDTGSGMQDADPLMAGATIGQTFTTATGTFTEVPDDLREKTEVSAHRRDLQPGRRGVRLSAFDDTTVLDQTFNDVDLVGRPLTIGNFVSSRDASPALIFGSPTNTYTPYIDIGDEADPTRHDTIIQGTPYQEVLTNFPLASQILTGLFLNVTLSGPIGPAETYQSTLFDRIGYAARQNGTPADVAIAPSSAPAVSDHRHPDDQRAARPPVPRRIQPLLDQLSQEQSLLSTVRRRTPLSSTTADALAHIDHHGRAIRARPVRAPVAGGGDEPGGGGSARRLLRPPEHHHRRKQLRHDQRRDSTSRSTSSTRHARHPRPGAEPAGGGDVQLRREVCSTTPSRTRSSPCRRGHLAGHVLDPPAGGLPERPLRHDHQRQPRDPVRARPPGRRAGEDHHGGRPGRGRPDARPTRHDRHHGRRSPGWNSTRSPARCPASFPTGPVRLAKKGHRWRRRPSRYRGSRDTSRIRGGCRRHQC